MLGRVVERRVDGSLQAEWIFDDPVPGELGAELSYDLGSGDVALSRSFEYDGLHRPTSTRTCIDDDGTCTGVVFDVELAYDGYYGWPKGTKLPSGEIVAYDRNAYGFSIAERNPLAPVSDDIYRTTLGMNARGKVTHERLSNGLDPTLPPAARCSRSAPRPMTARRRSTAPTTATPTTT